MASLNKAMLIGNLGKDPELRYIPSGKAVASFPLATSENYKDKTGNKNTRTVWHNIVIWGKLAEIANQFLKKGSQVYLEGRIENRSYDDKDGNRRYVSEIILDFNGKMIMLGQKGGGDYSSGSQGFPEDTFSSDSNTSMPPSDDKSNESIEDDLPF